MTTTARRRDTATLGRKMLNKVPEVTIFFWVIKIMCTTVGETAADYLNDNLGFGLTWTTVVTGVLLVILLAVQFRLLAALAGQPGAVLRRRELVRAAWPEGAIVHDNTLDQYVARLRRKLRETAAQATIETSHGVGYRLR